MRNFIFLVINGNLLLADRLDQKPINIHKLNKQYEKYDDIEIEDLPTGHRYKPKEKLDIKKMDPRDHLTTWNEAKKGKTYALYVETIAGKI